MPSGRTWAVSGSWPASRRASALAQQVPALVELDLDVAEAFLLVLVEAFAGGLALEGVLLFDQGADAVENLPVVHGLLRGWAAARSRR